MNAKEFFYLVSEMRHAQEQYFKTRDRRVLAAAKMLEKEVDAEIDRVRTIVNSEDNQEGK